MVLYIGKSKFTPALVSPQSGIVPVGTINIIENGLYNITTYANAEVNIPMPTDNVYSLRMVEDVEKEICFGTLSNVGNITLNILGDNSTLTPLRDDWKYQASDIEEIYHDILYSDHKYAEEKFIEVLGE